MVFTARPTTQANALRLSWVCADVRIYQYETVRQGEIPCAFGIWFLITCQYYLRLSRVHVEL